MAGESSAYSGCNGNGPTGLISPYTYIEEIPRRMGGSYIGYCYIPGTHKMILVLPEEFKFALLNGRPESGTRIPPCVIGERAASGRLRHFKARLLVPEGAKPDSELFGRHSVVADLRIDRPCYAAGDRRAPKGYFMRSAHVGEHQEFYAAARGMLDVPDPDSLLGETFQARIVDPHKGDGKLPFIHVMLKSSDDQEVFMRNEEALEKLRGTPPTDFWPSSVCSGKVHARSCEDGDDLQDFL